MSKADNKELEEAINNVKKLIGMFYEFPNPQSISIKDCEVEDIEAVLKELERLQEENKDLKKANREKADKLIEITDLYMKSIPKDKIREEIKELQNMKVEGEVFITSKNFAIKTLKGLLEEK